MTGDGTGRRAQRRGPEGRVVRASGKDGPQIVHSSGSRWTDEAEELFLDQLGASCNVRLAAEAAGFSKFTAYKRRRTDPGFAARWQAALEQGYVRIEMELIRSAEDALAGRLPDPERPIIQMTVKDALNILQLHRASVRGDARPPAWPARPRTLDEMRDSILKKLSAIARKRGKL